MCACDVREGGVCVRECVNVCVSVRVRVLKIQVYLLCSSFH